MRWVNLFVACAAAGFFCSGIVRAANDSAFQIADWTGRAYLNQKEKRLDRCSAQMTNANKITIIFSLDRHYMWTFELSNPTWNFPKGAAFEVTFGIGNNNYFRQRVSALDAQLVRVLLPDSVNAFEAFRRVLQLELIAGGLTSQFNMAYANQTLDALMKCVMRYGPTPQSRAAVTAWLKSPIGPAAGASDDPEIQKETSSLASAIISEAALPKASSLKPGDVPAGTRGDSVWKAGDSLLTVSILPKDKVPEIGDLADLIVGGEAQKCRGDFFSGTMLDVIEAVSVARAYTNCQTQQAAASVYYLAMPRKQGGIYLLTSIATGVEVTPLAEKNAKEIDGKVRASITAALAKM
jgi:hypothetical protein